MLWTCLWERLNEMDGNPATVWFLFLWMVTEREKKRKVKATQPQRRWRDVHGNEAAKNLKTSLKTLSTKALHTTTYDEKIVFFLSSTTRRYFKELLLPLHSLPPFPKHDKQMKEPSKGRCRLGSPLSFYLPSPHTSILSSSPMTWLKSAPKLLWTEPRSSHVGRVQTCL